MMNFRFREKVNTWPAFVDLFSNLVIILIFLLIVFVFLWTTTSVFNKESGAKTVADLRKTNEEQAQKIVQMTAYEEEAKRLLVLARNELESSSAVVAQYQAQIAELESGSVDLQNQIAELTTQLNQATLDKQRASELEQERRTLQEQMNQQRAELAAQLNKLQAALNAAEEEAHQKDIQYVEMSNRLNKALADKVAELNDVAKYQSAFYKSIKDVLGDGSFIQPEGDRFIVSSDILFGSGSYTLSPEGKNQLRLIANVINDLENTAKMLVKYNGDTPIWFSDDYNSFVISDSAVDGFVHRYSYGQDIGYMETPMTYPGELVFDAGNTVVNLLDKICETLGNYEYFYDLDGHFVFQEKKNYLNNYYTPIVELETENYV